MVLNFFTSFKAKDHLKRDLQKKKKKTSGQHPN